MGNSRDTGYLRELVTYDESNNVTFPANVSLVAPTGGDNSTKVPSTAWVRTYVSGVASLSTSGTSGANGSSGSSGQTGAAGSSGSSGSSGQTGAAGSSGSSGSSGQTGAAGSSGSSGSSGQTGATGSSGSSGSSGNTGAAGSSGSSGQSGATGSSGSSGQSGAAGSSGSSGSSGTRGSSGSSGSSGQNGAAGSSGSSGQTGGAGSSGSSGSSGQTGGAGSSGTSGTSPSAAAFVAKAGDTMTGTLRFTDSTNGIYKSGDRLTIRSESTDNVANFANYGLYLPVLSQTAGLYVESPIEARTGLRIGSGAASGTITVGADTAATANRLAQRDSSGDIAAREFVLTASTIHTDTPSSLVGIYPTTNQVVKFGNIASRNFLNVPTRTGGDASGTWGINISGTAASETLSTVTARGASTGSFVSLTGGSRLVIQNSTDGGNNRGIFMWNGTDTNWGIYMATAGAGKALSDGTAPAGLDGRTDHAIRFRVATSTSQIGFLWENSDNTALMQLQPNTGTLLIRNRIVLGVFSNSTTNTGEAWIGRASDRNSGTMTVQLGGNSASNREFEVVDFAWSVVLFRVGSNGNVVASGDITAFSDRRIKENIVPIGNALNKVVSLNGVYYNRIDSSDKSTKIGFIAQDVMSVVPELVCYDSKQDKYSVSYANTTALIVEAIKEQQTQIEDQASEIRRLKSLIGSLLGTNLK